MRIRATHNCLLKNLTINVKAKILKVVCKSYVPSSYYNKVHWGYEMKTLGKDKTRNTVLCAFTTDTTGELDVLGHNGHTLGMDSTQIGVFKQTYQISL